MHEHELGFESYFGYFFYSPWQTY